MYHVHEVVDESDSGICITFETRAEQEAHYTWALEQGLLHVSKSEDGTE